MVESYNVIYTRLEYSYNVFNHFINFTILKARFSFVALVRDERSSHPHVILFFFAQLRRNVRIRDSFYTTVVKGRSCMYIHQA